MMISTPKITAVITTYNAETMLLRTMRAIGRQTLPVDSILIANNGNPLTDGFLEKVSRSQLRVVDLRTNTGPAGGFYHGMTEALSGDSDFFWLLADDIFPEARCLSVLFAAVAAAPTSTVAISRVIEPTGVFAYPGWNGVLTPRSVVDVIGLPIPELFWWGEDAEYLQKRPRLHGVNVVFPDSALAFHAEERRTKSWPVWKYYYVPRNMLYLALYSTSANRSLGMKRRMAGRLVRLLARMLRYDYRKAPQSFAAISNAILDGLRGELPRRYLD